jgi:hypothetical protein
MHKMAQIAKSSDVKQSELNLKSRELALKEQDARNPSGSIEVIMARERMAFEASESYKAQQVELAKAIMAQSGPEGDVTGAAASMAQAAEIMERIIASMAPPDVVMTEQVSTLMPTEI